MSIVQGFFKATVLAAVLGTVSLSAFANINKNAPKVGSYTMNIKGEPTLLNPITSTDLYASNVQAFVVDSLMARDPNTYEWMPRIAEKFEVSKDGKVFTFFMRKDAVFHDGKPVTAEDVKFSFDVVFDPKYETAHRRPYFEGLAKVEVVDPYTVKFYTKEVYFKNFDIAASLEIVPKHIYGDPANVKKMNKTIVSAGPYVFDKYEKGQRIVLKRFDKWYGSKLEHLKGAHNFDTIVMRFVKDENVELEMAKKGDIDYLAMTAEAYVKKTEGAPWGTKIIKNKVENSSPKSYGFIGWNLTDPKFNNKETRVALAHLMNREEMNKKFRYGMSMLATGPTFIRSDYANSKVKPIEFNPAKAQELLKKAGWADTDKNGTLDKVINGQKTDLKFTLIHANKDNEKYWTMYKEDLKRAGVDLEIKYLEWNSFLKNVDDMKFEAVAMGWGGGDIDWDPKQIWHSESAIPGGSNFISYKNPKVDKLIDQARAELDKPKRAKLIQEMYAIVAEDAPYVFMFNDRYNYYMNNARVQKPADTLKYEVGSDYWWLTK